MRFCFCRWLQNQTRTTFFFRSSFSAIAAIFSPDGRGWTAKYASNERFSGAAMLVRFRFFSPAGNTEGASGSRRLFFAWASASSSHAWRIGFRAIMLLNILRRRANLRKSILRRSFLTSRVPNRIIWQDS
ncbi:Uncharacterized protein DBV15_09223 [Temnothorax longispinosus]|uniref:Uncharacterized protein n=1 Tax=Temnothorax longispinosus TaxID=300112 RepID=A0A4S2L5D2_9HYME|nr:Uncharacterized protein DBV15_09223 [Temnothorax longispinosus]